MRQPTTVDATLGPGVTRPPAAERKNLLQVRLK